MPPSTTKQTIENDVKNELRKVKVLVVKSVAAQFRRICLAFTREAMHLDQSLLTTSQINTLKSDPNLSVTESTVVVAGPAPDAAGFTPPTPSLMQQTPLSRALGLPLLPQGGFGHSYRLLLDHASKTEATTDGQHQKRMQPR